MAKLKDRNRQIPNGFVFVLPEVNFKSGRFDSFQKIVSDVSFIINGNLAMAEQRGWPTQKADIEDWVDDYNARVCDYNGWDDYITGKGEQTHPKSMPPLTRMSALAAGAKSLAEMLGGERPVEAEQSAARAKVCTTCPKNLPGDLTNFFERATADLIRRRIEVINDLKLTTPHDQKLGVCDICLCPMRLKVHVPIETIARHMPDQVAQDFPDYCWIKKESSGE